MKIFRFGWLWMAVVLGILSPAARSQDSKDLDKRVTDFTLANGFRVIVMERHAVPLVSCVTSVNAGSVNEAAGQTGLARLVERVTTKGSETLGTRNWPEEKKALDAMDEAYERMDGERNKGPRMNQDKFDTLKTQWRLATDVAFRQGQAIDYLKVLEENGATGLKSSTTANSIQFTYTLTSNRVELWFAMESQRLMHPALREFYEMRELLVEEEHKSAGTLQTRILDALTGAAFYAHPYRVPGYGFASDLAELSRAQGKAFVEKYFVPGNIVMTLVGDVNPDEVKRLAEKYMGSMPERPMPPLVRTVEPQQLGPRTVVLELASQPVAAIAYKRPSYADKDDTALDVLQAVLAVGKGGMLHREMVEEKRIAANVQVIANFPDGRYPCLFAILLTSAPGHSVEENQKALDEILLRLRTQKVPEEVLNRAKAQVRAISYARLASNTGVAELLAIHAAAYGDWKKLFTLIEDLGKVTQDDVLRVAQRYFGSTNRTMVITANPAIPAAARTGGQQ